VEALKEHDCLIGSAESWHFRVAGATVHHRPAARWRCNNGTAVAEAAMAGLGLCQLPEFYLTQALAEGGWCRSSNPSAARTRRSGHYTARSAPCCRASAWRWMRSAPDCSRVCAGVTARGTGGLHASGRHGRTRP
jgi:DNA-binding transcriptional LysR family regulator